MKQTRTTLKALTAAYRAVLRHGILCNAIALGLIATAPAMADVTPATERLVVAGGQTEEQENVSWSGFSGSSYGGAAENSGTIIATNVEFKNNTAGSMGGAIDNFAGTLTINGASNFSGNTANGTNSFGGAIDNYEGILTINNGVAFNTNSATNGGAISNVKDTGVANATISGATFTGNTATAGGALYDAATSTITGVENVDTFKQNSAEDGGAIFIATTGNTTVNDATFKSNTATGEAGAVYNKGILNVTNSNFDGNTSNSLAGAIYNIGTLSVIGSTFDGNNSAQGGAIIDNTEATGGMTIISSTFKNNTATVGSGAIGIFSGNGTTIDDVKFISNSAGEGGALFVGSEATANIINGSVFDSNTATTVGGAIATRSVDVGTNSEAKLDIVGATFKGNSAGTTGGAIDNNFYNSVGHAGSVYVSGTTFGGTGTGEGNSAANGGAIYNHANATQTGNMYIADSTFTNNYVIVPDTYDSSTYKKEGVGGAIASSGNLTVTDSTFSGNTARTTGEGYGLGGALSTVTVDGFATNMTISGSTFTGNSADVGGAVYGMLKTTNQHGLSDITISGSSFEGNHALTGSAIANFDIMSVSNSTFSGNTTFGTDDGGTVFLGSESITSFTDGGFTGNESNTVGGAIATRSINNDNSYAKLDISGTTFKSNSATTGGAIDNNFYDSVGHAGSVYVSGATFGGANEGEGNSAVNGGAIYNHASATRTGNMYITGTDFIGNNASEYGGAIYNQGTLTLVNSDFISNTATITGGAIYNDKGTIDVTGSLFKSNEDGAIYNDKGNITLTDVSFKNNTGEDFGAIGSWNKSSVITINAQDADVVFSGNTATADADAGDIYNSKGTINLNAANGRTISMDGGIVGAFGSEKLYINSAEGSTGIVDISGALKNHTVNVAAGELHLSNGAADASNIEESEITVASGATLNSIDNLINDYMSTITLSDGALVAGDVDYAAGLADTYSADSGATITYKLANALNLTGVQYGAAKEIRVTNTGATVNKGSGFAWFDSDHGLTLESGGAGTGTILVSGTSGGINAAVDATDENRQEIEYALSAASETFDGADNVIQNANFAVSGNGNETTSNKIVFAKDMIVDGQSTLSMQDINLEKTDGEAITVQQGGTMYLTDARVGVDLNILGTLVSDPTYYDARVVNSGEASFTGDVFEDGSSLTNSATVNLNNVEFASGSLLKGLAGNVLNLAGTANQFNGASTGNNVVLASGANYTGTLADGSVDARNGGIDTITGSVSGGDLYVDADLTSGAVDTFGGTSGATLKGIKLANTGYGTDDKVELTIGEAELANDLTIDGTNYYTSVTKDGNNIVFSDKLINESNLYSKLAWDAGTYIKPSVSLENTGDDYMTVGQALTELDTRIATLNGDASTDGSVSKSISDALVDLAASNTYDTYGAADTALTDAKAYVDGKGYQTANDVDSAMDAKVTALDLDNTYAAKGDVADSFTAVHGEINDAISAAAEDATTKADAALAAAKDYVDGKGYQTADDVTGAINSALAGYTTTDGMSTAIDNAIGDALADYTTTSDMTDAIATAKGEAISSAKDYTDGAIETALADYTTTTDMNTAIDSAIGDALADYTTTDDMTDAIATAKGEAISSAKDYTDGAIETALADYTTTAGITTVVNEAVEAAFGDGSVVANAVDERIEASLADDGAINTAISGATKMGTDGDDSVSMYAHFDEGASVTEAAAALDTAVSATESDIATLKGEEGTAGSVKNTAKGYADTAENNAKTFATSAVDSLANGAVADNTVALSLLNGDANTEGSVAYAAANAVATANAYTDSKLNEVRDSAVAASNAYTDRRIEDLDKNLSAGVAGAVALSSVAVSGVERGEVSVGAGYGYFNGQSAAAFGATMGLSNRWSINAGAGISNADVSFRAGTNYKFKLF